jgi:hypothetical protein
MPLLQRLHKFYRSEARIENRKMPLENFTTECLVGILESHQGLLHDFAKKFLKIEEVSDDENIIIQSQKYYVDNSGRRYIDIVIEGNNWICFIENKVESQERRAISEADKDQIPAYMEILDQEEKKGLHCYMRYCTKWSDPKVESKHHFYQFLWNDIARFLNSTSYKNSYLIQDFTTFLTSQNMAHNMDFQAIDIVSLEHLQDNLKRMDQYLEKRIRPLLNPDGWKSDFYKQANAHNRHILWQSGKYMDSGYWDICIGFVFDAVPGVSVTFYINRNTANYVDLLSRLKSPISPYAEKKPDLYEIESGAYFQYRKPIGAFSVANEMEGEITEWFRKHIKDTVCILKTELPEAPWEGFFADV